MSAFINPDGEYPRHIGDIELAHPDWDGDLTNLPEGWHKVEETEMPAPSANLLVVEGAPELVDGAYKQTWVVTELTDEEVVERRKTATRLRVMLANISEDDIREAFGV